MNIGLFYRESQRSWSKYGASGLWGVIKEQVVRRWPFIEWQPIMPLRIQVEVTSRCNLSCPMCARTHYLRGTGEHMSLDTFRRVLQEFKTAREVHLQGWGEPFMHPQIFEMIALANPNRRFVSTNSNITVIDERMARRIFESKLTALRLSLDGITPKSYEFFRPPAGFDRVIKNLRTLLEIRREIPSQHTAVTVVVVCQQGNVAELPDFVHMISRLGVDELRVQEVREFGDLEETRRPTPTDMSHAKEMCQRLSAQYGTRLDWSAYTEWAGDICEFPWRQIYIRSNGKISLCCEKFFTEAEEDVFGDVNHQTGRGIWSGQRYRMARRELAGGGFPTACRKCPLYGFPDVQLGQELVTIERSHPVI